MQNPFEPSRKKVKPDKQQSINRDQTGANANLYNQLNLETKGKYQKIFDVLKYIDSHKWAIIAILFIFTDFYVLMFAVFFEKDLVEWIFKTFIIKD